MLHWLQDNQYNDTQHNDTHQKQLKHVPQHNDDKMTLDVWLDAELGNAQSRYVIMLSFVMLSVIKLSVVFFIVFYHNNTKDNDTQHNENMTLNKQFHYAGCHVA